MKTITMPQASGRYLRYVIYGFNDGLVSNLALVAGLTGALLSGNIIVLAGLVVMIGAAISMGLGAYISAKSQNEYYGQEIDREKEHVYQIPTIGKQELQDIYSKKGFKGKELTAIVNQLMKNKRIWLRELTEGNLGIGRNMFDDPVRGGIVTFIAFVIGAIVPLLTFIFIETSLAFMLSIILSALILFIVGVGKTHFTKRNGFKSGVEMLLVGLVSAGASYYCGSFVAQYLPLL